MHKTDFPYAIRGFALVPLHIFRGIDSQGADFYEFFRRCAAFMRFHIVVLDFAMQMLLRRTRPIRIIRLIGCRASRHLSMSPPPSSKEWIKPEQRVRAFFRPPPSFCSACAPSARNILTRGQFPLYNLRFPASMPAGRMGKPRQGEPAPAPTSVTIQAGPTQGTAFFLDRS